ncbi:hypothetical protein SLEP1_g38256 [Rubroshorea leprosula]|uniref:Uncharacterized protein n=1 Tax=Rubroshorea leprosula TaxID=152421 RepID=A0AAV5KX96_9ROSI|nr:hypothetical protein SLEP1_g38256 [Rubroshorea leprosula]
MAMQKPLAAVGLSGISYAFILPARVGRRNIACSSMGINSEDAPPARKVHISKKPVQALKKVNYIDFQPLMEPNAMQMSERRTAGFLPTVWDPDLIISSSTGYKASLLN